jgi:hypothetical protein
VALDRAKSVKGADDLLRLSKALKAAGKTELRKELHKAMPDAAKPLIPDIRDAARRQLPHRGGLNERIARKPYRAQVRTGAKTAGVRIVGTKVDPRINQGRVFHPVFGRKGKPAKEGGRNSVVQKVPQAVGYFDDTLRGRGPATRDELRRTFEAFLDRIVRG